MKITNQHGDVILKKAETPKNAKFKPVEKGFVIEKGEGIHTHTLIDGDVDVFVNSDGEMYLKVKSQAKIDHEEHKIQVIEPGLYKKVIEREFDYEEMEARNVID